jgi:hypothetical protein
VSDFGEDLGVPRSASLRNEFLHPLCCKRQSNQAQVPACMVEFFKTASNTTRMLGKGFSAWQKDFIIRIVPFYKILKSKNGYGSIGGRDYSQWFSRRAPEPLKKPVDWRPRIYNI